MTDTDNLSRRRFLKGTGAAATATALAGCTGDGGGNTTSTDTSTGDGGNGGDTSTSSAEIDTSATIRSTGSTMDTLDPIKSTDTASGKVIQDIFDALFNYPNGQTNVQKLLAKSMATSDGGSVLTFDLKQGVEYNNGTEVTAADVVYSFERLAASTNSRRQGFLLNILGVTHETTTNDEGTEVYKPGSLGVEATGDYTVEITLNGPFYAATTMLAYSAFSVVPEGIVGDISGYDGKMPYKEFATENPVGTGPYTLENWEQSTEVRLSARESWHGGEIQNAGVHYAIFQKTNPAYTYATVNVNADGPVIPAAQYKPDNRNFEGTDDRGRRYGTYGPIDANGLTAEYYEVATLSSYYLGFNMENVPKPVRKAFSWVINQQTVANQIIPTPAKQAYFFTPPALFAGGPDNYSQRKTNYPYGYQSGPISEAKRVMEEAGYGPDNRWSGSLDMSSGLASSWGGDLYTLLRDKLTQAYIDIEMQTADWSTYLNRARNGNVDAYFLGWIADYPGIDNFLNLLAPSATDTDTDDFVSYFNWEESTGSHVQEAQQAWEKIQNNYGPSDAAAEARAEAGLTMEQAAWADAVYVPLYHGITQGYSYDWLESPRVGAMGGSRAKTNTSGITSRPEKYQ